MKNGAVYILDVNTPKPNGAVYRDWADTGGALWQSRTRISNGSGAIWGLEPGTYEARAVSYPSLGYVGLYQDDPEITKAYLQGSIIAKKIITVDESSKEFVIDFADGHSLIEDFSVE